MTRGTCAYCGKSCMEMEKEHVFPRCLYPPSRRGSRVQRLTVPACAECNRGWSKDEEYFRNVLLVAGDPNPAVAELWEEKAVPSFQIIGGSGRRKDLLDLMGPVMTGKRLQSLFVRGDRQRQGIGRALVTRFEEKCRRQGSRMIRVAATRYGAPLYLAMGYRRSTGVRVGSSFEDHGLPVQPMKKILSMP